MRLLLLLRRRGNHEPRLCDKSFYAFRGNVPDPYLIQGSFHEAIHLFLILGFCG